MLMDIECDYATNDQSTENFNISERFYILKLKSKLNPNKLNFIMSRAKSKVEAYESFYMMRPREPFIKLKDWEVLAVYNMNEEISYQELYKYKEKEVLYYIEESKIGTYYPEDLYRKIEYFVYRPKASSLVYLYNNKKDLKKYTKDRSKIMGMVETDMASRHIGSFVVTKKEPTLSYLISTGDNINIVCHNDTIENLSELARDIYARCYDGDRIINFYYWNDGQLCRFFFVGRDMIIRKL